MIGGEPAARVPRPSRTETAFVLFQRLLALSCLVLGVLYWVRLMGFHEGAGWRFDLMPNHWRVAAVTLAALFPFAAIGLWMLASWGAVVWVICALVEAGMYAVFPDRFGGSGWPALLVHGLAALLFVVFRVVLWRREKEASVSAH